MAAAANSNGKAKGDWLANLVSAWAEHELRRLHLSSSLYFSGDFFRWHCDPNLLKMGGCDPWKPIDAHPASNLMVRSTSPSPHTTLDEFGYCFRSLPMEIQCLITISHFEGYAMLHDLRILQGEGEWRTWMTYFEALSPAREELSRIIAASWLALRLAWRHRPRRSVTSTAS